MFSRFDRIPACDRPTDRQTSCHGIVRAMHTRRAVKIKQYYIFERFLYTHTYTPLIYGYTCDLDL